MGTIEKSIGKSTLMAVCFYPNSHLNSCLSWGRLCQLFAAFAVMLCLFSILAGPAYALERQYRTELHNSAWSQEGVKSYECHLIHPVPLAGEARFSQYAGETVRFEYVSQQIFRKQETAMVVANPPAWRHDLAPLTITRTKLETGHMPVDLQTSAAGRMLQELENGRETLISYRDQDDGRDHILVAMSPVNFRQALAEFRDCQAALLAFKPEDVIDTKLYFETDKAELLPKAIRTLRNAVEYLTVDPSYIQIAVTGYADARGRRRYNDKLSEKRSEAVRDFLLKQGISDEMIVISFYGERKPAATNKTKQGRALNRRVHFQLKKDPPPPMEERRNARFVPKKPKPKAPLPSSGGEQEGSQSPPGQQTAEEAVSQSQAASAQDTLPLSGDDEDDLPPAPSFIDKSLLVKPGG